ncbi:hypothetical protein [Paenibacillus sp. N3.4]
MGVLSKDMLHAIADGEEDHNEIPQAASAACGISCIVFRLA